MHITLHGHGLLLSSPRFYTDKKLVVLLHYQTMYPQAGQAAILDKMINLGKTP